MPVPVSNAVVYGNWIVFMAITICSCIYAWILVERENKEKDNLENKEKENQKGVVENGE